MAQTSSSSSRLLRLRGMPFAATDEDVRQFFAGFTLAEVYLCKRDGRSTGEAYVVLETPARAEEALAHLNKKYMGSRYIELFEAAEADLAAVKKVLEDSRLQGCVVRLRGLPYTATAADVISFFQGVQLAEGDDAIVFTHTVDGRPTGEAYVELANEDAQAAAMTKHKDLMGTRYIEIFHSSKMDKLQAAQQRLYMPEAGYGARGWTARGSWAEANAGMLHHPSMMAGKMHWGGVDQLADSLQAAHISPGGSGSYRLPAAAGLQQLPVHLPAPGASPVGAAAVGEADFMGVRPATSSAAAAFQQRGPRGGAAAGRGGLRGQQPQMVMAMDGQPMYYMHPLQQGMMTPLQPMIPPYMPPGSAGDPHMLPGGGPHGMMAPSPQHYATAGGSVVAAGGQWYAQPHGWGVRGAQGPGAPNAGTPGM